MIYSETYTIMPIVKTLLGVTDNAKDALVEMIIDSTITDVMAYCRLEVLPYQLHGIIAQMAAEMYRVSGCGSEELPQDITGITQGDRSVSFKVRGETSTGGIMENYKARLKPYINRKGRVPSEV